jgi:hypothetical protein
MFYSSDVPMFHTSCTAGLFDGTLTSPSTTASPPILRIRQQRHSDQNEAPPGRSQRPPPPCPGEIYGQRE